MSRFLLALSLAFTATAAEKYTGPHPPKPDVPYLLHANKLVETETVEAREQQGKNAITYVVSGASSPARTPMAEPIFLFESNKISASNFELFRLELKGGNREITLAQQRSRRNSGARPLRLTVQKIADRLYKIEAAETLENGQYSLSPSDSNKAFCFEVY